MEKLFCVYILASRPKGAMYVGVTSDLIKRVWQHKQGAVEGHTKKYDIKHLVYYELYDHAEEATKREKRLKKYRRNAKIALIERNNPEWNDLYETLF